MENGLMSKVTNHTDVQY